MAGLCCIWKKNLLCSLHVNCSPNNLILDSQFWYNEIIGTLGLETLQDVCQAFYTSCFSISCITYSNIRQLYLGCPMMEVYFFSSDSSIVVCSAFVVVWIMIPLRNADPLQLLQNQRHQHIVADWGKWVENSCCDNNDCFCVSTNTVLKNEKK